MPNFDLPVPGITTPRGAPAYDYDSAIRRRMDPISQLDDSANSYAKTLADRRVEQANQASQNRMQALANSQQAQQAANYAKASKATTATKPTSTAKPTSKGASFKPGYANQMSIIDKIFPGVNATSTTEGSHAKNSYHYQGRAVDLPASMAIYNWIKANYPNSKELIFGPGGNNQIKNGKIVPASFYGAGTMSGHNNHIHWAY